MREQDRQPGFGAGNDGSGGLPPLPHRDNGEIDALLREWHDANAARALAGRDRLLASLGEMPSVETGAARGWSRSVPRIAWNRYAPLAAAAAIALIALPFLPRKPKPLGGSPVTAATNIVMAPGAGRLQAFTEGGDPLGPLVLGHTDVKAAALGPFVRVQVVQKFHNPLARAVDTVYSLPLTEHAFVQGLTVKTGERTLTTEVRDGGEVAGAPASTTEGTYAASTLERQRPHVFAQVIGGVAAAADVSVEAWYVEQLEATQGVYTFVFPATLTPRFTGASPPMRGPEAISPLPSGFVARQGLTLLGPAALAPLEGAGDGLDLAALSGQLPRALPLALVPQVRGPGLQSTAFEATYADGGRERGQVFANGLGEVSGRWFMIPAFSAPGAEGRAAGPGSQAPPMAGDSTPATRSGRELSFSLEMGAGRRGVEDVQAPLDGVVHQEAKGGGDGGRTQVLVNKDGDIANSDLVIRWRAADAQGKASVYTGRGPQGYFFAVEFPEVDRPSGPVSVVKSPELAGAEIEPNPDSIGTLGAGQRLVLLGRVDRPCEGTITLESTGGVPWKRTATVRVEESTTEDDGRMLAGMWAKRRMDSLLASSAGGTAGRQAAGPDVREQVIRLSKDFGVLSPLTSFVAVDERSITLEGTTQRVKVPTELPDPWEDIFSHAGTAPAGGSTRMLAANVGSMRTVTPALNASLMSAMVAAAAPTPPTAAVAPAESTPAGIERTDKEEARAGSGASEGGEQSSDAQGFFAKVVQAAANSEGDVGGSKRLAAAAGAVFIASELRRGETLSARRAANLFTASFPEDTLLRELRLAADGADGMTDAPIAVAAKDDVRVVGREKAVTNPASLLARAEEAATRERSLHRKLDPRIYRLLTAGKPRPSAAEPPSASAKSRSAKVVADSLAAPARAGSAAGLLVSVLLVDLSEAAIAEVEAAGLVIGARIADVRTVVGRIPADRLEDLLLCGAVRRIEPVPE